jgi:hypothetical protein
MSNEIIDFIKKQDSVFDASKYFGGMTNLLNLSKTNNELKDFIDTKFKSSLQIIGDKGVKHKFNFYILDFEVDNSYPGYSNVNLTANLILDYPNLTDNEILRIGRWVSEYCDEGELYAVTTPVGAFPTDSYYMVMIQEINGKPVPWKLGTSFPNPDDMISDKEINKLLNKGVNGKEPVTESLIRLQSLFGKTL